jgi:hypothetical protein
MTRTALPYSAPDLSALARQLARDLAEATEPPGHLALMNMLARAAGFRNFQHFRASSTAGDKLASPAPAPADMAKVAQARRYFDATGQMTTWPAKTHLQHLCLWALWSRLPHDTSMTERQISQLLTGWHLFGDAAILRRTLWELKLVTRTADGRDYRRIEQPPPPEARELIRILHA